MFAAFHCFPVHSERSARTGASRQERVTPCREQPKLCSPKSPLIAPVLFSALLLLGCAGSPGTPWLGGIGDPVRGAALRAPSTLGDTSRWAGRPWEAAEAAAELEFLANEFATNPRYAPEANPAVSQQLEAARQEMRSFLGVAPDASTELVRAGLRRAAAALRTGSRAGAEAALSGPAFAYGPSATLGRLASMPRLPRVAEAAGGVAAEIDRRDRQR
ncbi:MAG: hypothetical protein AVDCRST_MAG08-1659 [uncultured Acetobacteraceae bacterium]|uniref:Uncharacterized protein n=2 Tax=Pseudomonadati TaxID=3379134 RepID=A0A6J4PB83_9BACT|nr:MAG: hypothetical protein AVDCRST_MAG08-1659 [uncultured Acetobacteraceae bacterium]CAA9409374.1 MAG: hypothetical protein AVDCRST_MAG64-2200 [uncultured Phycisphaerae bacterium]